MLPVGHIAAGYLTTKLAINSLIKYFPQADQPRFWVVGIIAAAIIDFDTFYAFFKIGKPISSTTEINHRRFFTHTPFLHLAIGFCAFTIGWITKSSDLQIYAILYSVGMLNHFVLDSLDYGIMLLWPFSRKIYALKNREQDLSLAIESSLQYWTQYLKKYRYRLTFYVEVIIIALGLLTYFKIV